MIDVQLLLKVGQVFRHLLDGRIFTLWRVSMIPGVRDDDGPLGEMTDHSTQVGMIFFPSKQRVLDQQWRLTILLYGVFIGNL